MSDNITLRAPDGHELTAYEAKPQGEPIAGLVVVQEIFGVNAHIRKVTDGWARDGFLAVAPAMFDRIERGVELGYDGEDLVKGRSFSPRIDLEKSLLDLDAALDYVKASTGKKAGVIGYCYGGSMAWLAATRLHPNVAVGYYGGKILSCADDKPRCPVQLHFGKEDAHIPVAGVEQLRAKQPGVEIYLYDAGHGFNCDVRASYNAEAARQARERSLAFLKKHLA
jgi:carboxymethylenebutenolidase